MNVNHSIGLGPKVVDLARAQAEPCGVQFGFCGATLLCLLLGTGCGRIGFDKRSAVEDAAAEDASTPSATAFSQLCAADSHVIIQNGIQLDDDVASALSSAVEAGCASSISRREVSQDDPTIVDSASGRPLTPARDLVVLGGGEGPHRVVRYLLEADTPLIWTSGSAVTITERKTGRVIAEGVTDDTQDFILLQVIFEPVSGTLSLSGQGMREMGTRAAAFYFSQTIVPLLREERASWFVVRWTDATADGPTLDDGFELIESGSP